MQISSKIFPLLFGVVLLTSGLFINLIQFSLFLLLKPICGVAYNKINYYLNYSLYSQIVFLEQHWANLKLTLHIKKGVYKKYCGKEHGLLLMNHSYEIDWMIGWILCDNCHILGNVKTFAKKSLQYLPPMGISWWLGGSIFVERDWKKDQNVIESKLGNLVKYDDPIWMLLAAEGTRFTKEKHEASLVFAKERGLPELRHHLTPRTKGFTTCIPILRKRMPAVYDVNIVVKPGGPPPNLTSLLLGKPINADCFVERYDMTELPESEEGLANWLHSLYKRKDDLHHSFLTTGKWQTGLDEYESFLLKQRIPPALSFAVLSVSALIPWGFLLIHLLTSGSWFHLVTAFLIIGSFIFLLDKLVGETKISKASSYGTKKT